MEIKIDGQGRFPINPELFLSHASRDFIGQRRAKESGVNCAPSSLTLFEVALFLA